MPNGEIDMIISGIYSLMKHQFLEISYAHPMLKNAFSKREKCIKMHENREDDMDWIIILFFIYLSTFWVEKLEESTCRSISAAGPNLKIWVQKIV